MCEYNFPNNLIVGKPISIPLLESIDNFNFYIVIISDGGSNADAHWSALFPSKFRFSSRAPSDSLSDSSTSKYYDINGIVISTDGNNLNFNPYAIINPSANFDSNNYISVYGVGRK